MYVVTSLAGESTNRQGKWMGALVFFSGNEGCCSNRDGAPIVANL